jgi:parallel beta-helix repeat protein
MNARLIGIIVFLVLIVSFLPINGTVINHNIPLASKTDKTLYVGGNGSGNYSKIQDAINDAVNGFTVFVFNDSSPYNENILINKSINLIGEEKNTTIIDGNGKGDVINVTAINISIVGFTITNSSDNGCGVKISANSTKIFNNIIKDFESGIFIYKCSNHLISGNILKSNISTPIDLLYSSNNIITNNTLYNHIGGGAIFLYYACYNIVNGNSMENGNPYLTHSSNYNIWSNNIVGKDSTLNIYKSSNENIIFGNIFKDTWQGIKTTKSQNNRIYHNQFLNNAVNAYDEGNNIWDNGYPSGGNYWEEYDNNDYDNDGIGDAPYNISGGNNIDRYPLGFFDYDPPIIDIITPKPGFLYFKEQKLMQLKSGTVFLGDIVFIVNVTDDYLFDLYKITYYVDGERIGNKGGLNKPYTFIFSRNYLRDRNFYNIFKHKLKIRFEAVDHHGNIANKEVTVWKYF